MLEDAGLRDKEREATYTIERSVTGGKLSSPFWSSAWVDGLWRFVAYDVTTAYGLQPTRALSLIVGLSVILTPFYMAAIPGLTATSHVVQIFPQGRLDGTATHPTGEEKHKKNAVQTKNPGVALYRAAYFSLISAFNIGLAEFNPGDWIRRLQPSEYSLEAVGWVRVVAGIQSLLSLFLLAMWVLTQFGRSFE